MKWARFTAALGLGWAILTASAPLAAQADVCAGRSLPAPGVSDGTLEWDGLTRSYLIYTPESLDTSQPVPVVFSLHGLASNARQQMRMSAWNDVADSGSFLVVYPQGIGAPTRWNAGYGGPLGWGGADDVGFLRALAEHVTDTYCTDPARVFVNGMSNGGGMTYRLACEASDLFAAFGGVAGAYAQDIACAPNRPLSFMFFHGTADPIVPLTGAAALPDVPGFVAGWAERGGCNDEPVSLPPIGDVRGVAYTGCAAGAEVTLYLIEEGGHTWPGGPAVLPSLVGNTTQDIDASATLWAFYQRHPLAGSE